MTAEKREFIAHDHPAANARVPLPDDIDWTFRFTLEDGTELRVKVGETGYRAFESMFIENRDADYQERDLLRAQAAAHAENLSAERTLRRIHDACRESAEKEVEEQKALVGRLVEALRDIAGATDDPDIGDDSFRLAWQVICRVHQIAADGLAELAPTPESRR